MVIKKNGQFTWDFEVQSVSCRNSGKLTVLHRWIDDVPSYKPPLAFSESQLLPHPHPTWPHVIPGHFGLLRISVGPNSEQKLALA